MRNKFILVLLVFLSATNCFSEEEASTKTIKTALFTIQVPKTGWVVKKNLPEPYLIALVSEIESGKDTFMENLVIYRDKLADQQSLEDIITVVSETAKSKRPDFIIVNDTRIKAGKEDVRRQVCTMTFPEFVSKNIQYFMEKDGYVYVMVASIPEDVFEQWQAIFDTMVKSFRVDKADNSANNL